MHVVVTICYISKWLSILGNQTPLPASHFPLASFLWSRSSCRSGSWTGHSWCTQYLPSVTAASCWCPITSSASSATLGKAMLFCTYQNVIYNPYLFVVFIWFSSKGRHQLSLTWWWGEITIFFHDDKYHFLTFSDPNAEDHSSVVRSGEEK